MSGEGPSGVSGRSGGGKSESRRIPFLTKTYQMVDDPSMDDLISWNEDGTTLIVWRPFEFAQCLLPKHFKHNNFANFVCQLNLYGFRKVRRDRWEFTNNYFRRGEKALLKEIKRRKGSTGSCAAATPAANTQAVAVTLGIQISPVTSGDEQVLSSNLSPGASVASATLSPSLQACSSFREENDKLRREISQLSQELNHLRRENSQLSQEVNQLKSLYSNIYNLISSYRTNP